MVLGIESIVLCFLFTVLVYSMSKDPIKTVYNYPPKIQERIYSLEEYKDTIPSKKNKIIMKILASMLFLLTLCLILRYINGYETFKESFIYGFLLWTIVNLWDCIVLDCIWFCHDKQFILKGTEDMIEEYHNYWFHIKGFMIGEVLSIIICFIAATIIQFIL